MTSEGDTVTAFIFHYPPQNYIRLSVYLLHGEQLKYAVTFTLNKISCIVNHEKNARARTSAFLLTACG
jgi:hypothetical protein